MSRLPKYDVVYARNNERGCTFVMCFSIRDRIVAIHKAMEIGVDWIEVWEH